MMEKPQGMWNGCYREWLFVVGSYVVMMLLAARCSSNTVLIATVWYTVCHLISDENDHAVDQTIFCITLFTKSSLAVYVPTYVTVLVANCFHCWLKSQPQIMATCSP